MFSIIDNLFTNRQNCIRLYGRFPSAKTIRNIKTSDNVKNASSHTSFLIIHLMCCYTCLYFRTWCYYIIAFHTSIYTCFFFLGIWWGHAGCGATASSALKVQVADGSVSQIQRSRHVSRGRSCCLWGPGFREPPKRSVTVYLRKWREDSEWMSVVGVVMRTVQ